MSDVTFRNNSAANLSLILPGGNRQDTFPKGNVRTYPETGRYDVKDGPYPIFSFTFFKGSLSTDLTGIGVGGSVTFDNQSGDHVNVVYPSGQDGLDNGSLRFYTTVGTYTIKDLTGNTVFDFKYDKGTATTTINKISPSSVAKSS